MRNGSRNGAPHVPNQAARARAERLWREAVADPSATPDNANGATSPHLTPTLSSSGGGEGDSAVTACVPPPPFRGEGESGRWVRKKTDTRHPSMSIGIQY